MNIGQGIKKARKLRGIKQVQLAEMAGIGQSYLSLIESGTRKPSLDVIQLLAFVLKLPPQLLVVYSLSEEDIPEGKRELFRQLKPSVFGLLESLIQESTT